MVAFFQMVLFGNAIIEILLSENRYLLCCQFEPESQSQWPERLVQLKADISMRSNHCLSVSPT